jgi:hypothetical protein
LGEVVDSIALKERSSRDDVTRAWFTGAELYRGSKIPYLKVPMVLVILTDETIHYLSKIMGISIIETLESIHEIFE